MGHDSDASAAGRSTKEAAASPSPSSPGLFPRENKKVSFAQRLPRFVCFRLVLACFFFCGPFSSYFPFPFSFSRFPLSKGPLSMGVGRDDSGMDAGITKNIAKR